jgi:hypothetical protein
VNSIVAEMDSSTMAPLLRDCPACDGMGATGGGRDTIDGPSLSFTCSRCDGERQVPVLCACDAPAVHDVPGLEPACDACTPGGCAVCFVWGRECCRLHKGSGPASATSTETKDGAPAAAGQKPALYRPELKVIAGEHQAFALHNLCDGLAREPAAVTELRPVAPADSIPMGRGACLALVRLDRHDCGLPAGHLHVCQLVAGHRGAHREGDAVWGPAPEAA